MPRCFRSLVYLAFLLLLFSCKHTHHSTVRGFYYWKTVYKPTAYELNTLRQLSVRNIYLRLFDVDYDYGLRHAIPIAPVRITATDTPFRYVPVVFITQRALVQLNDSSIQQLAQNICTLSAQICSQAGIQATELQIDCDWTANTSKRYFALLQAMRQQPFMAGKVLSCTIRLNQVKYRSLNGIPPVDKGLIMVYGMGDLKKAGGVNSILDPNIAEAYLKHMNNYPLPLDVALPLFEWCVVFRGKQFVGILHDATTADVKACSAFRQKADNIYECVADTLWHGCRFHTYDIVRLEQPSYTDILKVAKYSSNHISNKELNVILFAMDSITLSKFSHNEMETIFDSFN